jgi:hypothetical protein
MFLEVRANLRSRGGHSPFKSGDRNSGSKYATDRFGEGELTD